MTTTTHVDSFVEKQALSIGNLDKKFIFFMLIYMNETRAKAIQKLAKFNGHALLLSYFRLR